MTEVMSKVMSCRTLLCRSMHMRFAFLRPSEQCSWNSILAFQHPFQGLCNQRTIKEMILGIKLSPLVLVFILHHISTSMRWKNQWGRILYCCDVIPKEINH